MTRDETYVPALGNHALTPFYDVAIALLTRERVWRQALLAQVAPKSGDTVLDIGCGTGSFAVLLKKAAPGATVIGLDPDREILERARMKARAASVDVDFQHGYGNDAAAVAKHAGVTKVVSSLVFHQVPVAGKKAALASIFEGLPAGGELHIADYGLQRTFAMRTLFRQVQRLDGFENTEPNAKGMLPHFIADAGFSDVRETKIIPTLTGSISLYAGRKI